MIPRAINTPSESMPTLSSGREFCGMARPSHAYSWHAPQKPHISVPPIPGNQKSFILPEPQDHLGSGDGSGSSSGGAGGNGEGDFTQDDLRIITQGRHEVSDRSTNWRYEMRRAAQQILPFLYLGPSTAAKDRLFLAQEGITMLLVVRDSRTAMARLLSGEKAARELGIEASAIDVADNQELIAAFPRAIKVINDHLLKVYQSQMQSQNQAQTQQHVNGDADNDESAIMSEDPAPFKLGKVLVFCETGNERSASVVAAYLMFQYGLDIVRAMQYVCSQRFCAAYDDELKHLLWAWQDIIMAKRDVMRSQPRYGEDLSANGEKMNIPAAPPKAKRVFSDTSEDMDLDDEEQAMDRDRFEGRANWVPFLDDDVATSSSPSRP